jgi:ribosomal protein S27E
MPGDPPRGKRTLKEAIEVFCPRCKRTEIIFLEQEEVGPCPVCKVRMVIRELLKEGKSY